MSQLETLRKYVAEGIPEFDAAYDIASAERHEMTELLREGYVIWGQNGTTEEESAWLRRVLRLLRKNGRAA